MTKFRKTTYDSTLNLLLHIKSSGIDYKCCVIEIYHMFMCVTQCVLFVDVLALTDD